MVARVWVAGEREREGFIFLPARPVRRHMAAASADSDYPVF